METDSYLRCRTVKSGLNVYRYANRIPLLFEPSSDVIFKTASELKWAAYKINKNEDKIGVFVSIVSTKIPFKVRSYSSGRLMT